jgi:signal transduction histidine kinase/ActR/RegA family two-component response regulator
MIWDRISDDAGLDWIDHDVRQQIARIVVTILACIFSISNLGLIPSLVWFAAALLAQFLTYRISVSILSSTTNARRFRLATALAMLFETLVWSYLAYLYWQPPSLIFCLTSVCILAGQLLHSVTFASRSRVASFVCGVPPGLILIGMSSFLSGLHGTEQIMAFVATTGVGYYAFVSASASYAAQSALEEQRSFAQGIIEALDSRIGIIDERGDFIHTNRVWRDRIGAIEQRTNTRLGTHMSEHTGRIPGRKGQLVERQLAAMLDGQVDSFSTLYRANVEGLSQWFSLRAFTLKDAGQAKVLVIQDNVTEIKASEAKLRQTNRGLRRARLEADMANRAKSRFLATMGHEIRTPLNGIVAIADVLSRSKLAESDRDLIDTISSSADTLSGLLVDMLDVARIEAGRVSLERAPFHLGDALRSVIALSNIIASEKDLALNSHLDPTIEVWVMGDLTRFKQVATNLIANAVKFTDKGNVTVSAKRNEAGAFEISVADTGIGFDPTQIDRLFNPFEQADDTVTRRFGGTGLGLAIVKQLILMMGGKINCTSVPERGSEFHILLPLAITEAPPEQVEPSLEDYMESAPLVILVVDDHPVNRKVVGLILNQLNIQLVMAENGEEAVQAFYKQPFDAVLMDMQMPVMDGLAATRAIREIEQKAGQDRTPVIMFSANALTEHIEQSLACGADMHLAKPITAKGLLGALASVLNKEPNLVTPPMISA